VAGKAWHRKCWESTQNYTVRPNELQNQESCPACSKLIASGEETTVSKGRAFHRKCFRDGGVLEKEYDTIVYN
jgi:hypothetical protein